MIFTDRRDAGRQLAQRLQHLKDERNPPVVLGLPRGGVVVAAEVARALDAPLDVLVVRKIGAPHQPELAIGAVTDTQRERHVLNRELITALGVDEEYLRAVIAREFAEVCRRQDDYRRGRAPIPIQDRTVIIVDDGVATGATVWAGAAAIRQLHPSHLTLAVPVGAPDSLAFLQKEVDELICLEAPFDFMAVGGFYDNFQQTTDEEVKALLDEADQRLRAARVG